MMRMTAAASLAVLLSLSACSNLYWHGESLSKYYAPPSTETGHSLEERQVIVHWTKDPKAKQKIGYLEKYALLLEGSREPHDIYYIRSANGIDTLGYINENGVFFRYTKNGQVERVGEYPIRDVGIRVFYGFPKGDNLAFEDINPYQAD